MTPPVEPPPSDVKIPRLVGDPRSEREKRRGAAIPWFPQPSVGGALFGYSPAAILGSKLGLLALVGGLVSSSWAVGTMMRRQIEADQRARISKKFQKVLPKKAEAVAGGPIVLSEAVPNDGMAYIRAGAGGEGSPSADGAAAAGGEGSGDGSGAGNADGATGADAVAAAAASAEAAGAGAATGTDAYQAGKLKSVSLGGKLSGGAGMSGGVGRSFGSTLKPDAASLGQARAFSAPRKATVRQSRAASGGIRNTLRSATGRKLQRMAGNLGANRAGNETSAAVHNGEWSSASPSGQSITGPGAAAPAAVPQTAVADAGEGGPLPGGPGPGGAAAPREPPDVGKEKNVTPYQGIVDVAKVLLVVAGALLAIAGLLALTRNPMAVKIAKWVAIAAAAVAAAATLMGIALMAMGQKGQGLIFTAVGGLMTAIAVVVAVKAEDGIAAEASGKDVATQGSQEVMQGFNAEGLTLNPPGPPPAVTVEALPPVASGPPTPPVP